MAFFPQRTSFEQKMANPQEYICERLLPKVLGQHFFELKNSVGLICATIWVD